MSDYFIFDNIDTRNYDDILVYFNGIDTTPKRVGEFIEIPNRNGSFFLDGGRYEDVTHVYDVIALSKEDASDLINALASKVGYCRLEDSFNSNEFYSAIFNSETEPKITKERDKLTFKVTFTRKPQRWLTSGETAIEVTSGDTITNPTLFESSPLLEVEGYGTVGFNGHEIEIEDAIIGAVSLAEPKRQTSWKYFFPAHAKFDSGNLSLMQDGDPITWKAGSIIYTGLVIDGYYATDHVISASFSITSSDIQCRATSVEYITNPNLGVVTAAAFVITIDEDIVATKGQTTTYDINLSGSMQYTRAGSTINYSGTCTLTLNFYKTNFQAKKTSWSPSSPGFDANYIYMNRFDGYSSQSVAGHPLYIDCDRGDAYKIEDGQYASMNKYIDLGSNLPTFASGTNAITFDNTITDLKVTPRWWKV